MSAPPAFKLLATISIAESKSNPRAHFDPVKLQELAESIKLNGVLEPILVREKGDSFELVCGHRRLRAAKLAGAKMIPAMLHELTDTQVLETQLEENKKRDDLHPLEEAAGYHALLAKKHGYTVAKLAERTTMSVKYIYDRLKLLELNDECQNLFLANRISAGHAILLARLSPKDQARAIDPKVNHYGAGHGVWQGEHGLFDEDEAESKDKYHGLKAVSVREFESWIDRSFRFDRKLIEPIVYPEAAQRTQEATDRGLKIVPITYNDGLSPDMKGDERTICCRSWKHADGLDGKVCEHAILGVVVVGRERSRAFDVCIAKEKCKTHWGKEIAARERNAKQREKGGKAPSRGKEEDRYKREREKQQRDHQVFEARRVRYGKARPEILKHLAATIEAASTSATGRLADVILAVLRSIGRTAPAKPGVARGKTAEDLVKHIGWLTLSLLAYDDWTLARGEFDTVAKALGIDVKAILDEHAPVEKPVPAAKGKKAKSA